MYDSNGSLAVIASFNPACARSAITVDFCALSVHGATHCEQRCYSALAAAFQRCFAVTSSLQCPFSVVLRLFGVEEQRSGST